MVDGTTTLIWMFDVVHSVVYVLKIVSYQPYEYIALPVLRYLGTRMYLMPCRMDHGTRGTCTVYSCNVSYRTGSPVRVPVHYIPGTIPGQYGTMIVIRRYAYNYIIIIIPGIYIYGRNFAASAQRVLRCRCAASRASIAGRNRHLVSSSACVTFQLRHVRRA